MVIGDILCELEVMVYNLSLNNLISFTSRNSYINTASKSDADVKTSIFYVNDLHSRLANMDGIKAKADEFKLKNPDADKFLLSGGDMKVGLGEKIGDLVLKFMNLIGIDLSAIGNHEFDAGTIKLQEQIDKMNEHARRNNLSPFKFVVTNLDIDEKNPLAKSIKDKKLVKSCIITRNGHNYGFVGATPISLKESARLNPGMDGIQVKNLYKTTEEIEKEVSLLEKQNINKIILLSHLGYKNDKYIANKVSGIDVIVGGHTHNVLKGIDPGKNLFLTPEKEPVILLEAGKDGEQVGTLDIIFDSDGIIKEANNKIIDNETPVKDLKVQKLKDEILGKSEALGFLEKPYNPIKKYRCENPMASLFADAMRNKAGAQIALMVNDNALVNNGLKAGEITTRDIQNLSPFKNKIYKTNLSGKELQEILSWAVGKGKSSSAIQVSGIKYTITNTRDVKNLILESNDNSKIPIDPDKQYSIVYDEHLLYKANYNKAFNIIEILNTKNKEEQNWDKGDALVEYIKSFNNKPFEIKPKNRITIEPHFTSFTGSKDAIKNWLKERNQLLVS
ncbi:MAG: hypothetical protein A2104_02695 [Candidatus Melainabacteria bacterium GWF2_32_7]|nr:MAG: hypothetical protein A2104_02695 [Candidatus Melainabacteria bacterium GWF2_32_7]